MADHRKPALPPERAQGPEVADDAELFRQAVADVVPLPPGPGRVPPRPRTRPPVSRPELLPATKPSAPEEGPEADEPRDVIAGAAAGVDLRTRRRLRRGEYPIEARLDLHGRSEREAEVEIAGFLADQQRRGRRCVLIIHGRGLNSPGGAPVLKPQMARWMTQGGAGRLVLAFCSARPGDGGTGAVYVLLRR